MSALAPGTLLHGRYTIQSVLGIGGFGITYEGVDNTLGRRVAIKELFLNGSNRSGQSVTNPPGYSTERWSKSITNFLHEARTLASIDDPSIVGVHDYFDENNTAYMVMKFIEGTTLDKFIYQHGGRLATREAFGFTRQIGRALELLHASNILHRDVKPSNVIVTPAGRAVLIDFGSAREFAADRTVQQTAVATMGFAPPEQYHAFGRKGAFTDVYALSATCYYMLSGEAPGSEISPAAAGSPLMPALLHALAFNPQDRTPNVPTFLAELENPALVPPQYAAILAEQYPSAEASTNAMSRAGIDAPTQPGGAGQFITPPGPAITDVGHQLNRDVTNTLSDYMRGSPAQPIPYSGMPLPQPPISAPPTVTNPETVSISPVRPAPRRSSLMLITGAGVAVTAVVALAAFMLFGGNQANPNQALISPSPTVAPSATIGASPTAAASPTLFAMVITPTETLAPVATDTEAAPTDSPLPSDTPAPTDTLEPAPTDTAAPQPTDTAAPPPPPTRTPLPLRPTATPRPPAPPTSTPRPLAPPTATPRPPAPPTSTPKPLPANLGQLDLAGYCQRLNDHAKPAYLNGSWACYSFDLANSEATNANQACVSQYGGASVAAWTQVDDAASWYCARNGSRTGSLNMTAYCQRLNPLAKYDFDTDPDTSIDPLSRWTCVTPGKIGDNIDANAAAAGCSAQYNVAADAYQQGNQWYCRRQ